MDEPQTDQAAPDARAEATPPNPAGDERARGDVPDTASPGGTPAAAASAGPDKNRRDTLAIGIDVGGTGVKAAIVDLTTGALASPRIREKTPSPSTPEAIVEAVASLFSRLNDAGYRTAGLPTGAGLPGIVKDGRLTTAANIDKGWVNAPAQDMFSNRLGQAVTIINDADAAGIAEMRYGAGRGHGGVVLLLTLGTGIGSALFMDGRLVVNTEFGHLEFHGKDAETLISGAARERRKLGWKRWAHEFSDYMTRLDRYFSPDLVILGGGVSKESARFWKYLDVPTKVVTATLLNSAGIVGAALAGAEAASATGLKLEDAVLAAEPVTA